jgi:hypothetical protein
MRKQRSVSVSVGAEDYKYLQLLSLSNGETITDAVSNLIKQCEKNDPRAFNIIEDLDVEGAATFYVTVDRGEHVCVADSLDEALQGLTDFREKHELDPYRFELNPEVETWDQRDYLPQYDFLARYSKIKAWFGRMMLSNQHHAAK